MTKPRLLVVDDEAGMREVIINVAELAGFEAIELSDPTALEQALNPAPDVVVLDLVMPGRDGVEVIRHLASLRCNSRLILVSGLDRQVLDSAARLAEAHGLDVVAHLSKPIRAVELRDLFAGVMKQKPRHRGQRAGAYKASVEELEEAIKRHELVVHLQPQVRLSDGAWIGVEALVRWRHQSRGLLYPDSFIEMAEGSELALPLTNQVMEDALKHCAILTREHGFHGKLSVNVPAIALHDVSFPDTVVSLMTRLGSDIGLIFEVTETSVSAELVKALDVLTRLRMKGIGLSIDDFGTGQSGLERLHTLPFTELKVDMAFVRASQTNSAARVIVENSIALARSLGLTVVAEGVENEAIWQWLSTLRCDVAQGYYVSKPLPFDQVGTWVDGWRTKHSAAP